MPVKIAPSILAADFTRLAEQLKAAEKAGAALFHIDVMDGHFVPNISFGPLIVAACRRVTDLPLDVHLMIAQPERFIADFAAAGASHLTIQAEATVHLHRALEFIHQQGLGAGLAVNPLTPLAVIKDALPYLERVLIMSVNPGFGGQSFIKGSLQRIAQVATWISADGHSCDLEVDGGINARTIKAVVTSGANVIVAGTAIFNESGSVAANMQKLSEALRG